MCSRTLPAQLPDRPARDFLRSQYGLQIVFSLRRRAASFENVRQCRQAVTQTLFRRLLNAPRIHETCSCRFFLPLRIQQPVIGLRNVIDQLPVNIVESEVRSQEARAFGIDPAAPRAEIQNRISQIQRKLKCWQRLAIKLRAKPFLAALDISYFPT